MSPHEDKDDDYDDGDDDDDDDHDDDHDDHDDCKCGATSGLGRTCLNQVFSERPHSFLHSFLHSFISFHFISCLIAGE